jgi:hypothetical protein
MVTLHDDTTAADDAATADDTTAADEAAAVEETTTADEAAADATDAEPARE